MLVSWSVCPTQVHTSGAVLTSQHRRLYRQELSPSQRVASWSVDAESNDLLSEMFSNCPDAIVVVDEGRTVRVASSALETLFGYRVDEIVGRKLEMLLPQDVRKRHEAHVDRFVRAPSGRPMGAGLELLGRRRDGSLFPVDVSLVPLQIAGIRLVGAFVRDATAQRRSLEVERFVNEVTTKATAGEPVAELLAVAADRVRGVADADAAWIVLRSNFADRAAAEGLSARDGTDGDHGLSVVASSGEGTDSLDLTPDGPAAQAIGRALTVLVEDLSSEPKVHPRVRAGGFGCGAYLPMLNQDSAVGCVIVARAAGKGCFERGEVAAAETFAASLAVVLDLASTRVSLDEVRLAAEQERIARDLHDTVIQRLFAIGMGLQAAQRDAGPGVADRLRSSVDAIDEVIREIRETIFDLNHPPDDSAGQGLRAGVRKVLSDAREQLGFSPRLEFRGPVEASVPDGMYPELTAVIREALSNVARHARATSADVIVSVEDVMLSVVVSDDGVGVSDHPSAGSGIRNLSTRAEQLGGDLKLTGRKPSGTVVIWRVPLR